MTDFQVVDQTDVPARKRGRKPTALSLALVGGQTVFVAGRDSYYANQFRLKNSYVAKARLRTHGRNGEHEGVKGVYLWAEKRTNGTV